MRNEGDVCSSYHQFSPEAWQAQWASATPPPVKQSNSTRASTSHPLTITTSWRKIDEEMKLYSRCAGTRYWLYEWYKSMFDYEDFYGTLLTSPPETPLNAYWRDTLNAYWRVFEGWSWVCGFQRSPFCESIFLSLSQRHCRKNMKTLFPPLHPTQQEEGNHR